MANLKPFATFDARSAHLTGLKMIRINRGVSFDHLISRREDLSLSTDLILQPLALILLRALSTSILLAANNSRQFDNSMSAFGSGGILREYEFRSRHSNSQSSSSTVVPLNSVRITLSHFAWWSWTRRVKVSFRSSSLSSNSV